MHRPRRLVGVGAVVTKEVPERASAAGMPARVAGTRGRDSAPGNGASMCGIAGIAAGRQAERAATEGMLGGMVRTRRWVTGGVPVHLVLNAGFVLAMRMPVGPDGWGTGS
jgi:hypothetical protein